MLPMKIKITSINDKRIDIISDDLILNAVQGCLGTVCSYHNEWSAKHEGMLSLNVVGKESAELTEKLFMLSAHHYKNSNNV